ncbi:type II toxin-antitoxin system RelE/ParE family toxin [Candidatus Peregrinibacteria bacterium]|nr:type II toxin-antitoxin system RelE/ParE family toxin [Candidatus Peregrinibacteria bacterium]
MNKIEKFLKKLRRKEQEAVLLIMMQLKRDFRKVPNLKPLVGKQGWYRIRVGNYRLIFTAEQGRIEIKRITKRDEQTYRNLN